VHDCRVYLTQIAEVYGGLDHFEVILAELMTCPPGSQAAALEKTGLPYILSGLQEAIRGYFDSIRVKPAPLYDKFARIVRPGDSVITFNYDLGIERALRAAGQWDVRTGYGFSIGPAEQPSHVEVLKLHGSTNWRAPLFGCKTGLGERPVLFFRADLDYLGYPDFVDPLCSPFGTAASLAAMIMPALPKQFYFETTFGREWKPFWDDLWERARCAIDKADELVIIGYSMPTIDQQARAMLFDTRNKSVRLSIYCGAATGGLEAEFRDRGFHHIQSAGTIFEDFLMAETAGRYREADPPIPPAKIQRSGRESTRSVDTGVLLAQRMLIATAKLGADGRVFYSEEGTPIQDTETTIEMLWLQLYGKASRDNIERFVTTLHAAGYAEIREAKPMAKPFTLG
jgi:hypothetical protein